jgi:hypothetical protein
MSDDAVLTLWLAPPQPAFAAERAVWLGTQPLAERTYLSRAELRSAGDADAGVRAGLAALFGVPGIRRVEHVWRRIVVHGAAHACAQAAQTVRASPLGRHVVTIFGLETTARVQSFAHKSRAKLSAGRRPSEIAQAYRMPAGLDGSGTSIGVLHFSGTFHPSDFERAMREAQLVPPRYVEHGAWRPSSEDDDFEIALDTQVAGAVAPGATLVLYRGADDARGYADTIAEALLDEVDAPQVLSISYGDAENQWSRGAVRVIDQLCIAAALCGITVVVASGDRGSAMAEREPHVMFPASNPHVLACGGTNLRLERGRRLSEHVWQEADGASGGGYSRIFDRPPWHAAGERAAGRGLPDVAAHAARLSHRRARHAVRCRRNERRRSALGRLRRARQSAPRDAVRFLHAPALPSRAPGCFSRHHDGHERPLSRARRLGSVHGSRQSELQRIVELFYRRGLAGAV